MFFEFNQSGNLDFLLFKFHTYFDGLLGINILTQIGAKIDLEKKLLYTQNCKLNLQYKPNFSCNEHNVPALSKKIINVPVDIKNGDIFIHPTNLGNSLCITEGIYHAENWHSLIEVTNMSNEDKIFLLDQPLKVHNYNSVDFIEIDCTNMLKNEDLSYSKREINNVNVNTSENNKMTKKPNFLNLFRTDHLNSEEKKQLLKLCKKFYDIFYKEGDCLTFTNEIKHRIKTTDDTPVYAKSYRYPFIHKEEVKKQISSMLEQGIIKHSYSPWSSPVWIVPKKMDASGKQKWRLVIDYRKLNEKTISDRYPIPNITDILDKLGKCMYFSTLDLASGFHQIEMHSKDIAKTAFTVEGGHYEYIRMPFGLKNAPSTFQRVMDNVLTDLVGKICLVYLDDIIIFSTSLQEHIENLQLVFEKLQKSNFKIQLNKSEFLKNEIAYLGHIVTTSGIKPNPEKIQVIQNFPIPRTQKEIKRFLGLLGYYRKFIKDFAKLAKPFTECLKKGRKIDLNEKYIETFEVCKHILTNDPILQYPDFSQPFILTTDASKFAIGAVLSQGQIGNDKPICYASRTLCESETNYSTIEQELLAIVWATKYFRPYLFGRKFKIVTDHKPLTWLMSLKEPNSKLIRWRLKLEEFDYEIVYKKGRLNSNVDTLSRIKINNPNVNTIEVNTNDLHVPNSTSGNTINSDREDLDSKITTSDRPINDFNLQLILEEESVQTGISTTLPFKNKQRQIIKSASFLEKDINEILKKYLIPNKLTAIYTDDKIFELVQSSYSKFFSNSKIFRLVRCVKKLIDITDSDEQETLIKNYHEKSNHRGIEESYFHLKRKYYFPFMKKKIIQTINNCEICQTLKYDRCPQKVEYQKTELPTKPLDIVHVDIYSVNKHQILTIIDKFSKFAVGLTLSNRTSIVVLKAFKNFITQHGIPKKVVCDQGVEFTANIFKDFCKQYEIEQHITSFQQTSSNSPIERLHSTLTEIYRIILKTRKKMNSSIEHDDILSETFITYNNSIHSTTKYTPFELFTGRTHEFNTNITFTNEHDYITKLNEYKEKIFPLIKNRVNVILNRKLEKLNSNREKPKFIGKNMIVLRKECKRNKITPRFTKHKVQKDNNVTVTTVDNKKIHKNRIQRKRKYT